MPGRQPRSFDLEAEDRRSAGASRREDLPAALGVRVDPDLPRSVRVEQLLPRRVHPLLPRGPQSLSRSVPRPQPPVPPALQLVPERVQVGRDAVDDGVQLAPVPRLEQPVLVRDLDDGDPGVLREALARVGVAVPQQLARQGPVLADDRGEELRHPRALSWPAPGNGETLLDPGDLRRIPSPEVGEHEVHVDPPAPQVCDEEVQAVPGVRVEPGERLPRQPARRGWVRVLGDPDVVHAQLGEVGGHGPGTGVLQERGPRAHVEPEEPHPLPAAVQVPVRSGPEPIGLPLDGAVPGTEIYWARRGVIPRYDKGEERGPGRGGVRSATPLGPEGRGGQREELSPPQPPLIPGVGHRAPRQ